MRDTEHAYRRNSRYCKYCRHIQMRDTEAPSQKLPNIGIGNIAKLFKGEIQNPHRRSYRYCKYRRIIHMRDTETPVAEIADIANIAELSERSIDSEPPFQKPSEFSCKYCRIMQMRYSETPSQKSQIFQMSQNYANERYSQPPS